jgi:flagellar protein FlaG
MLIQNIGNTALPPAPAKSSGNGGISGGAPPVEVTQAQVQPQQTQQPSPAKLQNEVSKINNALQQANKNLELSISVDKSTNKQIVKLTDKSTGDTILQYPSEAVIAIAQSIDEFQQSQQGLLLKQQA